MSVPVLVTGGAGFVGAHTIRALLNAGCRVIVADMVAQADAWRLKDIPKNAALTYIQQDLRDQKAVDAIFDQHKPHSVLHLAATASVDICEADPEGCMENNVSVTGYLASAAKRNGVKTFVFASSAAVYGDVTALPITESTPLHPISVYGRSKAQAEDVLLEYVEDFTVVNLRYFNIYGPWQEDTAYAGVMTHFFRKSAQSEGHLILGDGGQSRDFIYVGDIAAVNTYFCSGQGDTGTYNVCTGIELTVKELSQKIREAVGAREPVKYGPGRVGDIYRSVGKPEKVADLFPVWPRTTLDEGLAQTAAYFTQKEPIIWLSLGENCLPDDILARHGFKSYSTPYSSGRTNIDYALQLEKEDFSDLLNPEHLKYFDVFGKQTVRSTKYTADPIFEESVSQGFEFTHKDILSDPVAKASLERKIDRLVKLKNSEEKVVFLYLHRNNPRTDLKKLFEKLSEFQSLYGGGKANAGIIMFYQSKVKDRSERGLHLHKAAEGILVAEFKTMDIWGGNVPDIFWARTDDDLIKKMMDTAKEYFAGYWKKGDTSVVFPLGTSRLHEPLSILAQNKENAIILSPQIGYFHSPRQILDMVRVLQGDSDISITQARYAFRRDGMPFNPFDEGLFSETDLQACIARLRAQWLLADTVVIEISSNRNFLYGDFAVQGNPNYRLNIGYGEVWREGFYAKYEPEIGVRLVDSEPDEMVADMRKLCALAAPRCVVLVPHHSDGTRLTQKREDLRVLLAGINMPNVSFMDTRPIVEKHGFRIGDNDVKDIHHLMWQGVEEQAQGLAALFSNRKSA